MDSTISAKRKNDAVITVIHKNADEEFNITSINNTAQKLTGYSNDEIEGRSLSIILPEKIRNSFDNMIDSSNNDLTSIVRRIPNFEILDREGSKIEVSAKAFRLYSQDPDCNEYEILIRDLTLLKKLQEIKNIIHKDSDQKESMHNGTGLPNSKSINKSLVKIHQYVTEFNIEASFIIIAIKDWPEYQGKYNKEQLNKIIRFLGSEYLNVCRDEDIIGYLGGGHLGLILFDCNIPDASVVAERIIEKNTKMILNVEGNKEHPTQLHILYTQIRNTTNTDLIFEQFQRGFEQIKENNSNVIHETVT